MKILAAIPDDQLAQIILSHLKNNFQAGNTEVHFVHVISWLPDKKEVDAWYGMSEYSDLVLERGNKLLDDIADPLASSHKSMKVCKQLLLGHVAEQLIDYARKHSIDEIIVATHDRNQTVRLFLGSVASELIQYAPCTVTVLRSSVERSLEEGTNSKVSQMASELNPLTETVSSH